MTNFQITIPGSGSAMPTTLHNPPSQLVELNNKLFMVDCGEGTQLQMRKFKVDLLYHEATFAKSEIKRAEKTCHSTAKQAAQIAKMANVKKLVIGHYSSRYNEFGILLKEAMSIFPNTELASEGKIFQL